MNTITHKIIAGIIAVCGMGLLIATSTSAVNVVGESCGINPDSALCQNAQRDNQNRTNSFIQNVTNTLLTILGVIAVIAIIIGGLRYMTANGDSSKITSAKNTILYSVIGLIVAIMAWGIVAFVLGRFGAQ